jgi:hypothetical protein
MLKQIFICTIKIREPLKGMTTWIFRAIITRTAEIMPLSIAVVCDKGYDSEKNHVLVREGLKAYSVFLQDIHTFRYGGRMVSTENR